MPVTQNVKVKDGDVLLLLGTVKGAFLLRSTGKRQRWDLGGPHFPGTPVYAQAFDQRNGRHRLWAGAQSWRWGTVLRSSDDFGQSWTEPEAYTIKFPEDCGVSLKNIWQICLGSADEPDTLYCGVEPTSLFKSQDNGTSWALVRGLFDHPHRARWTPGNGGQCLHTIIPDPMNQQRLTIAMSTGGVYRTDDGGETWQARNQGIRAEFLPDKYPEFGQCVHKIAQHPARPERLYLQNHWGLYRSDDSADSWKDIAHGVPSDFGFAMAVHPHNPDTVYIVPLESDEYRCTPEGKLRVYCTRDGGATWGPLTSGLPQKGALETVLRDALATDTADPAGIYFGTRSGKVFGSNDEGKTWKLLSDGLPPVVCVKAAVVSGQVPRPGRRSGRLAVIPPPRPSEIAKTPAQGEPPCA
jgi:hypothetical protein